MRTAILILLWACLLPAALAQNYAGRDDVRGFIDDMVERHGFMRAELVSLFSRVRSQAGVLRAMAAPAESAPRSWQAYRSRFVNTARIDTWAFGLGSGIAGLAGCALSQVGNVGPDLGQSYIVDSFMVVVLGGVGQLAGTVYAALGLGVVNKLLEAWSGAVLAKIAVLVFIIIFIQKRPQGLFALKGRFADA